MIKIKRIYEPADPKDGFRILVDRLWPRGISKDKAKIDLWLKDIAPSPELRKWFNHKAKRFNEFKHKYRDELLKTNALNHVFELEKEKGIVTLLYAAKDSNINHAKVLLEVLNELKLNK